MKRAIRCRIIDNEALRGGFYLLRLDAPHIAADCVPGQFVLLRGLGADWPYLRRPFSVYHTDGDALIEIVYKVVGRATSVMAGTAEGEYDILGPLGTGFAMPGGPHPVVAVAGGAGLPPVAFYCRKYAGLLDGITLVIGARTKAELLVPVGMTAEGIDIRPYTDDGSKGTRGTAAEGLDRALAEHNDRSTLQVVACGPREMLARVAGTCAATGITCQVSVEEAMACGVGACMACAVPRSGGGYLHACSDGPVFDAGLIDWGRATR
jgi:dihydroorotate dehydrogenase electron transfer subunit